MLNDFFPPQIFAPKLPYFLCNYRVSSDNSVIFTVGTHISKGELIFSTFRGLNAEHTDDISANLALLLSQNKSKHKSMKMIAISNIGTFPSVGCESPLLAAMFCL